MSTLLSRITDVLLSRDPKIRSRLVFSWIAIYGYVAGSIVMLLAAHLNLVHAQHAYWLLGFVWVGVTTFYSLVRSGWSSRLGYPGMDFPQCIFALAAMMAAYVIAGPIREGVIPMIALLLIFGVFTLPPRQVLIVGGLTIVCLGAVVGGMVVFMPGEYDGRAALLKFTLCALIMPAISAVAYYVARIRRRMAQQKHELRQALAMLQEVAIRDDMTGLVNRRHMMQLLDLQLERQARTQEGFCVALIDLDHFKHVNDHFGHHVGDAVLKDFALAAVSVLRQTDVLARWGGEEFLLMMPNHSTHDDLIVQALDRIRLQLAALPTLPDNPVTFSAGVTCHPAGESLRETLERADRALYQAKANGRARTVVITHESDLEPQASPKHTSTSVVPK